MLTRTLAPSGKSGSRHNFSGTTKLIGYQCGWIVWEAQRATGAGDDIRDGLHTQPSPHGGMI